MRGVKLPEGFGWQRLQREHPRKQSGSGQPEVDDWLRFNNRAPGYTVRGQVSRLAARLVERNSFRFPRRKRNEFRSTMGQF